jgi:hypothetical protein
MPPRVRLIILRLGGILLVALGLLHLAVTPFIARMLESSASADALAWLEPPMLLNHVVVGVLLLPLGILIWYAAPQAAAGARWALVVSRTVAVAIATLPLILFWLLDMREYDALAFRIAIGIVCAASLLLLVVAFWRAPDSRAPGR